MNDIGSKQGSILFGGVDKSKYTGELSRIDVVPDVGSVSNFTYLTVALTSIEAVSSSGSDQLTFSAGGTVRAMLDTGAAAIQLPNEIAQQVWQEAGAEYSAELGTVIIPCSFAKISAYFSFGFAGPNGPRVNVTLEALVIQQPGDTMRFTSGIHKGQLAGPFVIQNASDPRFYIFGDAFLRSAYVVYDLQNNQIALATAKLNISESDIVAFPSLGAPIPSGSAVPSQNVTWAHPPQPTQSQLQASAGFQGNGDTKRNNAAVPFAPMIGLGAACAVQALLYLAAC